MPRARNTTRDHVQTPRTVKEIKDKFLREFVANDGQWTVAAKAANTTITLIRKWMEDDSDFKEKLYDADQKLVDETEQELIKKIRKGDITAICFYLKCKGKERGYIEKEPYQKVDKNPKKELKDTEFKLDFGE